MAKRMILFLATNFAILLMAGLALAVLEALGFPIGNQVPLLLFCAVWGLGGSFVSLQISRWMAKRAMRIRLLDGSGSSGEMWLHNTVANLARQDNLRMPEVGIYDSPEVNAFATGPSKKRSLVAVSTGLLRNMEQKEVEGVLAHEVSHIANGDMVTMTLIQGVVNVFVLYFSHVVAGIVQAALRGDRDRGGGFGGGLIFYAVYFVAQIIFGVIGSMITAWFSRSREFRADAGAAKLVGSGSMIAALERLQGTVAAVDRQNQEMATLKISGGRALMNLLSTHPPLEARIAALQGQP